MPFPESKPTKSKRYYLDHRHCGRSACTVQRSIIDLSGARHRLTLQTEAAPQIHNFIPSKTTVVQDTKTLKCNVVGMAEQISKSTDTR